MKIDFEHGIKLLGLERKYNKLKRDPESFLRDMAIKRSHQFKKHIPIKYKGKNNFTIVSAVYNVEKYLEEYFETIVKQSLDFKKHIYIICVDDGSTDGSAEIIKKWERKYSKNIKYVYKNNEGQSSARNLGLKYVTTDWVTFVDPDDFLDRNYFYSIDQALSDHSYLKMIVSNLHFFIEKENKYKDSHPLSYRFTNKNLPLSIKDLGVNINLSAASTLFYLPIIRANNILFDSRVKPNFEDGKFIADYLIKCDEGKVLFLKDSLYFYRKRKIGDSTLDTSWKSEKKYDDVIRFGFIPMLEKYKNKFGYVPVYIQRTALYDMSWYVQYLLNNDEKIKFLSSVQREEFLFLLRKVFSFIDESTILEFNLAKIWFFHKVGMLGLFKDMQPDQQIAYIEKIDVKKKLILITYFTCFIDNISYILNEVDIIPQHEKYVKHTFAFEKFTYEKKAWIPYKDGKEILSFQVNRQPAKLTLKGKQYSRGIKLQQIIDTLAPKFIDETNKDEWLFMDRDIQADDNAEHLYRFVKNFYPEQKIYFSISRNCLDWNRLKNEGFNLVAFNENEFNEKLKSVSKVISSQLDHYIYNYFEGGNKPNQKFVFLQHGVIKDDLSNWINSKNSIDMFVTSTASEYKSIVDNFNYYKLTSKEVVLTGLPRHDALLESNLENQRTIMIMPTWRKSIVGASAGKGTERHLNQNFMETDYAIHWKSLLHNPKLKALSDQYGYSILFAPHLNVEPYLEYFAIPDYISIWKASEEKTSIQKIFQLSALLITDYSSVAFEMGYLHKMVLYYQFDQEAVVSGAHTYKKGYFDYNNDGFGPVSIHQNALLDDLEAILKNNAKPFEPYINRMLSTFAYRDKENCKRVYEEIVKLDIEQKNIPNVSVLKRYIELAEWARDWELLKMRSLNLIEYGGKEYFIYAKKQLYKALINLQLPTSWYKLTHFDNDKEFKKVYDLYYSNDWLGLHNLLGNISRSLSKEEKMFYLESCSYVEIFSPEAEIILKDLIADKELSEVQKVMGKVWKSMALKDWKSAKNILQTASNNFHDFNNVEWQQYRPHLILARISIHLKEEREDIWLEKYVSKFGKDDLFYYDLLRKIT